MPAAPGPRPSWRPSPHVRPPPLPVQRFGRAVEPYSPLLVVANAVLNSLVELGWVH